MNILAYLSALNIDQVEDILSLFLFREKKTNRRIEIRFEKGPHMMTIVNLGSRNEERHFIEWTLLTLTMQLENLKQARLVNWKVCRPCSYLYCSFHSTNRILIYIWI